MDVPPSPNPKLMRSIPTVRGLVACAAMLAFAGACGGSGEATTSVVTVSKVTVSASATNLNVGQTLQLTAAVFNSANTQIAAPGTITWSSDGTSILTVDQTGKVTGVSAGNAVVTATVAGVKGSLSLRVNLTGGAYKDTIFTQAIAAFAPTFVTITRGSGVVFSLGFDGVGHDVQFNTKTGAPAYIPVTSRQNVSVTFPTAGEFTYYCPTHPQMTGTITVQ